MLEKPDLSDDKISACLQADYGFHNTMIAFLPLGTDVNAAVYRVVALCDVHRKVLRAVRARQVHLKFGGRCRAIGFMTRRESFRKQTVKQRRMTTWQP